MMYKEDVSIPAHKVLLFIVLLIAVLHLLPGNAASQDLRAIDFLGPKPSSVLAYKLSDATPTVRIIGTHFENGGELRLVQIVPLPPNVIADPEKDGEYLTHGYVQQRLFVDDSRIIQISGNEETVLLDMTRDEWESVIPLQIGCPEKSLDEDCIPLLRAVGTFRIASRTKAMLLGKQRDILTVEYEVPTTQYGMQSGKNVFISEFGMFEGGMPKDLQVEYLTVKELADLKETIEAQMDAFSKNEQ